MATGAYDRGEPTAMSLIVDQLSNVDRNVKRIGEQTAQLAEGQRQQWHELSRVRGAVETVSKLHLECTARQRAGQFDELTDRVLGQGERIVRLEAKTSKTPPDPRGIPAIPDMTKEADLVVSVTSKALWGKLLPWIIAALVLGYEGVSRLWSLMGGVP